MTGLPHAIKQRICLVGFAENESASIQAAIAANGNGWDCAFVPDAPTALAVMAEEPFDAVVVKIEDMGPSGAELLHKISTLYPHTLHFTIGKPSDQLQMTNSIGEAQNFIATPFEPNELIFNLQRGFENQPAAWPQIGESATKAAATSATNKSAARSKFTFVPAVKGEAAPVAETEDHTTPKIYKPLKVYRQIENYAQPKDHWLPKTIFPATVLLLLLGTIYMLWQSKNSAPDLQVNAKTRNVSAPRTFEGDAPNIQLNVNFPETSTSAKDTEINADGQAEATAETPKANPTFQMVFARKPGVPNGPTNGFDSVKVQGVFYRAQNPVALINGQSLQAGDRINDLEVIAVTSDQVVLRCNGETRSFDLD